MRAFASAKVRWVLLCLQSSVFSLKWGCPSLLR
jgi:hypothetical protein